MKIWQTTRAHDTTIPSIFFIAHIVYLIIDAKSHLRGIIASLRIEK